MAGEKNWKDLAWGGVILEGGNSEQYETGSWRTFRPVWHAENCIHCMRCWIMCPDSSILVKDEKVVGQDMVHCKGCGICNRECPTKPEKRALEMKLESDFLKK